ncbi:type II toxin-antitoxin system death-on-curing family toxin [Rubrobacter aplysinae]|uniref:type II toxin-antitoxin system death-on-curing family toxin n=1 Tax=Rubrobacter aplysinae TaxID=909625 RepID=UPI00064BA720|nr:type II toxin-antitoxin system death-on-curing family toxin [Rubrobacter aplysinae]
MEGVRPTVGEVLFLHSVVIGTHGGSEGVRDVGALEAAVHRPWGASFGREHFESAWSRAAALTESIIKRHPFVDGNKRTGVFAGVRLLDLAGYELVATDEELVRLAVGVAERKMDIEKISQWFADHTAANQ